MTRSRDNIVSPDLSDAIRHDHHERRNGDELGVLGCGTAADRVRMT
jgi:hypothetical protein